MATRSPSNRGLNVPPPARNYQDNTQAVRRMPDVAYGEQQALTEQQKAAPLPKDTLPQAQPMRRRMPEVDVFPSHDHLLSDTSHKLYRLCFLKVQLVFDQDQMVILM